MRMSIKTFGYIVSQFLYTVGCIRGRSVPRVYILMYHSIDDSSWKYGVSPRDFELQISRLRSAYTIVTLKDVVLYAKGEGVLHDKSVALTFDDGYSGVYEHVFPLAKKYNFPLTIYLSTDLSESDAMGRQKRLTWDQIHEMSESGLVSIEAHGHEHINFAKLSVTDAGLVEQNIKTCVELLQKHTGRMPHHFAYPSGHRSDSVVSLLSKYFESASGITEGVIRTGDSPYSLKRVQVDRTMSLLQFRLRIAGGIDIHRTMIDWMRKIFV